VEIRRKPKTGDKLGNDGKAWGIPVNCSLIERRRQCRDIVSNSIAVKICPRIKEFDRQRDDGARWKEIPLNQEFKSWARATVLSSRFMPPGTEQQFVNDSFGFVGPGSYEASTEIAMIKDQASSLAPAIINNAIHGPGGGCVSSDSPLAYASAQIRRLHFADCPDEVPAGAERGEHVLPMSA